MSSLVLGPVQRGLGERLQVWVETDRPCEVDVLARTASTFEVAGHHYALVELDGLPPGTDQCYEVRLDGQVVWPEPGDPLPPPRIRTWDRSSPLAVAVGSCRQAAPAEDLRRGAGTTTGLGTDALVALARAQVGDSHRPLDGLIMLGDQIYADALHPDTVDAVRRRRGGPPAGGRPEISSFEEYTWLYQIAWSEPWVRWLLASVPSVMVFDDHEIVDDWNSSEDWRREVCRQPWWEERIEGGLASYCVYQHLGNVASSALLQEMVPSAAESGGGVETGSIPLGVAAGVASGPARWGYSSELGTGRLVVVDSRSARRLVEADRSMLDEGAWDWLDGQLVGDVDHLVVATSVPWLLPPALHDLERWDEELTGGAWGRAVRRPARWLRRFLDLEHWAAFGRSVERLAALLGAVSRGERGRPPSTITVLSGDVHFGYLAPVDLGGASRVRQVTVTPFRQALGGLKTKAVQLATSPLGRASALLTATTPRARTDARWDLEGGPWFGDQLAVLVLDGRRASLTVQLAELDRGAPCLRTVHQVEL